jgi:hypothetical protein
MITNANTLRMDASKNFELIVVIDSSFNLGLERSERHGGDEVGLTRQEEQLLIGVPAGGAGHDNHRRNSGTIASGCNNPEVVLGGKVGNIESEEVKGVESLEIDGSQVTENLLDRALRLQLVEGCGVDRVRAFGRRVGGVDSNLATHRLRRVGAVGAGRDRVPCTPIQRLIPISINAFKRKQTHVDDSPRTISYTRVDTAYLGTSIGVTGLQSILVLACAFV